MFGIKGWADAAVIERYAHHWIAIGQAGRFFRLARAENCREVLFIGTLLRPPLSQLRLDWQTIKLMPRVVRFFRGGDDKLLSGVAGVAESGGLRVVGVKDVAPEVFVPRRRAGTSCAVRARQSRYRARSDGDRRAGPFDVGQAAVVANNNVLAVEAAEGTDNMLAAHCRIAQARPCHRAARRRRSGEGAEDRPGPALRPALDRAADHREYRARRPCRARRDGGLDHDRRSRSSHRGRRPRRNLCCRRARGYGRDE